MTTLGPIVVGQYDSHDDLIDNHVFPDGDAFQAWIDSQDVTVYLVVQPRDEVIGRQRDTVLWDRVLDQPATIYTPPEDTYERDVAPLRGLTTCSHPEVEHPGFPCNHPPFDPNA